MIYFEHYLVVPDAEDYVFYGDDFSEESVARYRVAASRVLEGIDRILEFEYSKIDRNSVEKLDAELVWKLNSLGEKFEKFTTTDVLNAELLVDFDEMIRDLRYIGDTVLETDLDQNPTLKFILVS